jgi:YVTN family beta-propeller protein
MMIQKNIRKLFFISLSIIVAHCAQGTGPNTVTGCVTNYSMTCGFRSPNAIAITPDGSKAYVCDSGSYAVSVIDVASDTVINCVSATNCSFNYPYAIAITPINITPAKAYVCNQLGNSVSVIDVDTDTVTMCVGDTGYPSCAINEPSAIAITPDGAKAYVCNLAGGSGNGSVSVIDVATDMVIACVEDNGYPSCAINQPSAIAITPDGAKAYVCNQAGGAGNGSVSVIDVASNTIIRCVENNYASCSFDVPTAIAITPDGSKAYVCNTTDNISVIDVATDTVIRCIDGSACGFSHPYAIAITPDGATAYVTNQNNNSVSIIDVATDTVIGCVGDAACGFHEPAGLAITPNGYKVYIANFGNGQSVSIIGFPFPNPPINAAGEIIRNVDCQSVLIDETLTITWQGNNSSDVVSYKIYDGYTLIATVPADPYATPYTMYSYSLSPDYIGDNLFIAAVSVDSSESALTPIIVSPYPTTIIVGNCLTGPSNVSGCKTQNRFLLQTDFINNITWSAPENGTPVAYKIYRDPGLTELVATVPANGPLQYYDHNRQPNVIYSYYIVSVDGNGNVSTASSVTVTKPC